MSARNGKTLSKKGKKTEPEDPSYLDSLVEAVQKRVGDKEKMSDMMNRLTAQEVFRAIEIAFKLSPPTADKEQELKGLRRSLSMLPDITDQTKLFHVLRQNCQRAVTLHDYTNKFLMDLYHKHFQKGRHIESVEIIRFIRFIKEHYQKIAESKRAFFISDQEVKEILQMIVGRYVDELGRIVKKKGKTLEQAKSEVLKRRQKSEVDETK